MIILRTNQERRNRKLKNNFYKYESGNVTSTLDNYLTVTVTSYFRYLQRKKLAKKIKKNEEARDNL